MNIRVTVVSFFILLAVNLLAQTGPKYIVEISLSDSEKLNKLEELEILVLHFTDKSLISIVTQPNLNRVNELNINFKILDEKRLNDKYYLASSLNQIDIGSKIAGE